MEGLPRTPSAVARQGGTSSENLWLSGTRVKTGKAFLGPSSPEIPVDLSIGLKSDLLG